MRFSSPLSSQQEVSAFGESGRGDTGDVWRVMCEGDYWTRGDNVMLKHSDTGVFLSASGHTFGRPINGQVSRRTFYKMGRICGNYLNFAGKIIKSPHT